MEYIFFRDHLQKNLSTYGNGSHRRNGLLGANSIGDELIPDLPCENRGLIALVVLDLLYHTLEMLRLVDRESLTAVVGCILKCRLVK